MDSQQQFELYKTAIIAGSGLLCALIGGGTSYLIATHVYRKQKRHDNQRIAISNFASTSTSFGQSYHDYFQTEITGQYLEKVNNANPSQLGKSEFYESRKHAYYLMSVLTKDRKEVIEALSMIELYFIFDNQAQQKMDAVYKLINIRIETSPIGKNAQELDVWRKNKLLELANHIEISFSYVTSELLILLKSKLN